MDDEIQHIPDVPDKAVFDPPGLPTERFLTTYIVSLTFLGIVCAVAIRCLHPEVVQKLLREAGVALKKVATTAKELERKAFHVCGLLVPMTYQLLLKFNFSTSFCAGLCWVITFVGISADIARLHIDVVRRNWPLKSILRGKELTQLCGSCYFSLGCTLTIHFNAPSIAMTAIIFLVLGDMAAAVIGRSFGQQFINLKLGREGKKSAEGSLAMFVVCMVVGCTIFSEVHLREYAVVMGSLVATLVELYEPFGINDNLSIPVLSAFALTFGFQRTQPCDPQRSPLHWAVGE